MLAQAVLAEPVSPSSAPASPAPAKPVLTKPSQADQLLMAVPAAPETVNPVGRDPVWSSASSADRLTEVAAALIQYRRSGDLRFVGQAQRLLSYLPESERGATFFLYRASVRQSLHQFDQALEDLQLAKTAPSLQRQVQLMAFDIHIVRGDLPRAQQACAGLSSVDDLFSASCQAQLAGQQDDAVVAYEQLKQQLAAGLFSQSLQARQWALVTLADLAERANRWPQAQAAWQLALSMNEDDYYARARLCELYLLRGDYPSAIQLSEGRQHNDAVAVCRAQALLQQGQGENLMAELQTRFQEAAWRGELLHKRAYGQYLLLLPDQSESALAVAEDNWQDQRELPDQRLLQAARARVAQSGAAP